MHLLANARKKWQRLIGCDARSLWQLPLSHDINRTTGVFWRFEWEGGRSYFRAKSYDLFISA